MESSRDARDDGEFLRTLGERVRTGRARRGMTRRQLAGDSGVSERYLAQLEGGQGNISIGRLRQVAGALGLKLGDLLREGPEAAPELALMQERLARLDGAALARVDTLLAEILAQDLGDERQGRIALIGLRGAGKSTLGRGLAERLAVPFIELVAETEAEAGMSAEEIFALSGQTAYRRHERRALVRNRSGDPRPTLSPRRVQLRRPYCPYREGDTACRSAAHCLACVVRSMVRPEYTARPPDRNRSGRPNECVAFHPRKGSVPCERA